MGLLTGHTNAKEKLAERGRGILRASGPLTERGNVMQRMFRTPLVNTGKSRR
jgi:hypothetical protein